MVIFLAIISLLETFSFKQIDDPYDFRLAKRTKVLHVLLISFSFLVFCYTIFKGGFVLYKIINDISYEKMHAEYNALMISAVCFSLIEFIAMLLSFGAMRRLKVIRITRMFNEKGIEIDEEGKAVPKKVDLKRLIILAKPVSILQTIFTLSSLQISVSLGMNEAAFILKLHCLFIIFHKRI